MPFVTNNGIRIHYEVEGRGPPLVLHTGAGGDLEIWRHAGYMERMGEFQRILVDQRGRGGSDRPTTVESHRIEHFVDDLRAVLDDVGAESVGFWGYSSGIIVGLAFAAHSPDRLRCLVGTGGIRYRDLSDLPPVDEQAGIREDVAAGGVQAELEKRMAMEKDQFPPAIDANVRGGDPLMHALDGVAWMRWKGPKSVLQRIRTPLLFLTGEREDPDRATESTVASTPGARMVRIPGVGHLGAFYRSDLAAPLALPFLIEHLH